MTTIDADLVLEYVERWMPDRAVPGSAPPSSESFARTLDGDLELLDHYLGHDVVKCGETEPAALVEKLGRSEWIAVREGEGLSQRELADLVHAGDPSNISRWESGRRWPGSWEYLAWLRETDADQTARCTADLVRLVAYRDGWLPRYTDNAEALRVLHDALFKPEGLLEKWRETGSLPVWTPADAGLDEG